MISTSKHFSPPRLTRHLRVRLDGWAAGSLVAAGLVLSPLLAIIYLALLPTENIWPHLVDTVLGDYIITTLIQLVGVGALSLVIGVTCAYVVTQFEFPGRKWFEWLLLLPLAMPAYVAAYVYTDFLEFAGPVQTALRGWFGWGVHDYWFPQVRSLGGAVLFMSWVLYPYVYLLARVALLRQSAVLLNAGRISGYGPFGVFWHIGLPIIRPAVAVGVALALMETLNDFGTADFFALRTLTAGLYDVWLNMGNLGGAAQIALVMLVFVGVLLALEFGGRRRQRHTQPQGSRQAWPRRGLGPRGTALAWSLGILPVTAGFGLPTGLLIWHSIHHYDRGLGVEFVEALLNSLQVAGSVALLCLVLGILSAYCRRLHPTPLFRTTTQIAAIGYALPGALLALGVFVPLAGFDNFLDGLARAWFDQPIGLLFSGSLAALILACTVRFMTITIGSLQSAFTQIPHSMDMAARSLGFRPGQVLARFHLQQLLPGALVASLVVLVDCLKELPATLLLRPFNFETLATRVYYLASNEMIAEAAPGALAITLCSLLPVLLLHQTLGRAVR